MTVKQIQESLDKISSEKKLTVHTLNISQEPLAIVNLEMPGFVLMNVSSNPKFIKTLV